MPFISRLFIKTSFVYFAASLLVGIATVAEPLGFSPVWAHALFIPYLHLLTVGWISQIIIGVGTWLFPKYSKERPRGPVWLLYTTYALLNTGLITRVVLEPVVVLTTPTATVRWLLVSSAVLQWLGGLTYATSLWLRVKGRK